MGFFDKAPTSQPEGIVERLSTATCTDAWQKKGRLPRPRIGRLQLLSFQTGGCGWIEECADASRGQIVRLAAAISITSSRVVSGSAGHFRSTLRQHNSTSHTLVQTWYAALLLMRLSGVSLGSLEKKHCEL